MQNKKVIIPRVITAAIAIAAVNTFTIQDGVAKKASLSNPEFLEERTFELRKMLPYKIDEQTLWSSLDYGIDQLIHGYSFTDISLNNLSSEQIQMLKVVIPVGLKSYVCSQKIYEVYWNRGITLVYIMNDKNDEAFAQAEFTKNDCAKKT